MSEKRTPENYIEGEYKVLEERDVKVAEVFESYRKLSFDPHKILVTYILFALNIVIWLIMSLIGMVFELSVTYQLVLFGAKVNELIAAGQVWRLLSAMFLHVNLIHLFFNSYALYIYGPMVEKLYGRAKYLGIYIISGIMGSLLSYLFNPYPAAGASGAIFGLMGAILFLRQHRRNFYKRIFGPGLIMIIVLNLVYGITQPGIDNWGHMGGLAGGYAVASGLGLYGEKMPVKRRILITVALIALFILGLLYGQSKYLSLLS